MRAQLEDTTPKNTRLKMTTGAMTSFLASLDATQLNLFQVFNAAHAASDNK
jgi:hypothetical protein